jgi:hypothetical protein
MRKKPPINAQEIRKQIDNLRETLERLGAHGLGETRDHVSDTIRSLERKLSEQTPHNAGDAAAV